MLTWIGEDGYFRGRDLISREQVASLITSLKHRELYCTIQDYNEDGSTIGCPIVFDIDSPSLYDAYSQMRCLVQDLEASYDLVPLVYFSGGKGFHVMPRLYIKHERCHEIARMISGEFSTEIDVSIYKNNAMLRVNDSYNTKSSRWKVAVNPASTLEYMVAQSEYRNHYHSLDISSHVLDISEYIPKLRDLSELNLEKSTIDEMTPCLRAMWADINPQEGTRHYTIFIMVRFFCGAGYTQEQVIKLFEGHEFWRTIPSKYYIAVTRQVFRSGKTFIGCKHGQDAEMLRPLCSKLCLFNDELSISELIGYNNK